MDCIGTFRLRTFVLSVGHGGAEMSFIGKSLTLDQIRQLDLVEYLATLGYQPEAIKKGYDYWYLSPLRDEGEASFKVNRELNCWYDHGLGKGGNLIDFGLAYFRCTLGEFREKFAPGSAFQQHQNLRPREDREQARQESKVTILSERDLYAYPLISYLHQRMIPVSVAAQYCRELSYRIDGRNYFGIGFKNDAGGFEIRNAFAKCSSSPKDVTRLGEGSETLHVIEGFFDLLSFKTLYGSDSKYAGDILVLNSAAFFERARPIMAEYPVKKLWLDHDTTGLNYTRYALSLKEGFEDASGVYEKHKDLNDFLTGKLSGVRKQLRQKIS